MDKERLKAIAEAFLNYAPLWLMHQTKTPQLKKV